MLGRQGPVNELNSDWVPNITFRANSYVQCGLQLRSALLYSHMDINWLNQMFAMLREWDEELRKIKKAVLEKWALP